MRKIYLIFSFLFMLSFSNAQLVFENNYSINRISGDLFRLIKFTSLTEKYLVYIKSSPQTLKLYNLDHSLFKTINWSINISNKSLDAIVFLSDKLFNNDANIELLFTSHDTLTGMRSVTIISENGSIIQSIDSSQLFGWKYNSLPFYVGQHLFKNTSNETKMYLESADGTKILVYGLPGKFESMLPDDNGNTTSSGIKQELSTKNWSLSAPQPNPSIISTKLFYTLPVTENQGTISLYNQSGQQIRVMIVDKNFDHIILNSTEIPAGTYYYTLSTSKEILESKKMIVLK